MRRRPPGATRTDTPFPCPTLVRSRRRRKLERERCAAVLLHELADPHGLLLDEGVQRHLAGLDHVQRLLPHRPGAGVGDGRGHRVDERACRIGSADGAAILDQEIGWWTGRVRWGEYCLSQRAANKKK